MRRNFLEIRKGYKIVQQKDNILCSCFNNQYYPGAIEYKVNEWVYPKIGNGPLAVFDNFENARIFQDDRFYRHHKIFSCLFIPNYYQDRLWFKSITIKGSLRLGLLPVGTVLASQIILIEEIK